MKKIKLLTLSVCLLFISNVCANAENNNGGNGNNRDIPVMPDTDKNNQHKSVIQVPFYAYLQDGIIYIGTTGEFSSIDVCVTNTTTNNVWNSILFFTNGIATLDISDGGFGNYLLEIGTEYGEYFIGNFVIIQ